MWNMFKKKIIETKTVGSGSLLYCLGKNSYHLFSIELGLNDDVDCVMTIVTFMGDDGLPIVGNEWSYFLTHAQHEEFVEKFAKLLGDEGCEYLLIK